MSQQTTPKASSWIRSLTYETGSAPVVNGFVFSTAVDTTPGLQLVTPFGTCDAGSPSISGPGSQSAIYISYGGGAFIIASLGFGSYSVNKSSGTGHTLNNTNVNNAQYNGAAFPIGATQGFTGSGSWTLDSTVGGGGSSWVVMKTRHGKNRNEYRYQLGSAEDVQAWVNAGDAGRHYWKHIRRKR